MSDTPSSQSRSTPPLGVEAVVSMIRQVGRLASRVEFERSFKLTHGRVSADRFLFGVRRSPGTNSTDHAITSLCQTIGMPSDFLPAFRAGLHDANHVYFGAERDEQSVVFKAYLEYRDKIADQGSSGLSQSAASELYIGYKWDPANPSRHAVSHYDWRAELSPDQIRQRVRSLLGGDAQAGLCAVTASIVERALETVTPQAIQFLEVHEAGNPRHSFDINVYKVKARLADWLPALQLAREHFAVPTEPFDALIRRIGAERVGHLAAGVDRHGRDFLTLYYGGTAIDGRRLAQATPAGATT